MSKHLSDKAIKYLESRKLDVETAMRLGAYSDRTGINGGEALVLPFRLNGKVVNRKYRSIDEKKFWGDKDAKRCLWNAECLEDPVIKRLIITEGEMDAICAVQSGFPHSVSVPNGAQANLDYLLDHEEVWNIPEIIIATDNDEAGQDLAKELVSVLRASRCSFIEWPDNCKDLNEVLFRHGEEGVQKLINEAKPYPVKGLYKLSDYPDTGPPKTFSTGWDSLDQIFKPCLGTLTIVTGVPSAGKSKWTAALLKNILIRYGHTAALASFEMPVVPYLRDEFRHQFDGKKFSDAERLKANKEADAWIEEKLVFIDQAPEDEDQEANVEWVLDMARDAVIRYGVKWLLIDPWNQLDDNKKQGESTPEYQKRAIKAIKRFAKNANVGVIIVAHPTKDVKLASGEIREPNLYDIDGSAHWYNATDFGVVVDRGINDSRVKISIKKARFKGTGKPGEAWLNWRENDGKYLEIDAPVED